MIRQENFSLPGSNNKLITGDITFDDANSTLPLVIFVHGFKGFKDWGAHNMVARYFAQNGFRYLKFNFSHSGVKEDNPIDVTDMDAFASNTISKELYDLDQVVRFACSKENFSGTGKVSLLGHSRGGGVSIIQASNDPSVDKLATWGAIADFKSLWKPEQVEQWRKEGEIHVENARTKEKMPLKISLLEDLEQNREIFDIEAAAKRLNIPWLIVHGDQDINVDVSIAKKLNAIQLNARLNIIEGADHVFGAQHPFEGQTLPKHLLAACEATINFLRTG
jgi:uncharacterized protein